jgi:hypothetical protein
MHFRRRSARLRLDNERSLTLLTFTPSPPRSSRWEPEIVPLTAIYEQIEAKRLILAEEFHELLYEKARLALQAAQLGPDPEAWDAHAQKWVDLQQRIYQSARKVFMLDVVMAADDRIATLRGMPIISGSYRHTLLVTQS